MKSTDTQLKKTKKKERKQSEKEFIEHYKDQAPKGPGFTWRGKLIYSLVFILFVLGFTFGKSIYIGGTPTKLIDYSLTQSLNTDGRDIDLAFDLVRENQSDSYFINTNLKYTFEYLTSVATINHSNYGALEIYLTPEQLSFRKSKGGWNAYPLNSVNINGLDYIDWGLFSSVTDIRSIPQIRDILKETVQVFMASFYNRFTFGENESIEIDGAEYDCKQVNLTFHSSEFYPLLNDFLQFNLKNNDIRNAIKDRVQRFLTIVNENELYDAFNLDKETVSLYLDDIDYYFDTTYYLLVDYIENQLESSEEFFDALDSEVTLSFYVDKKYNVRAVESFYTDNDASNDIVSSRIYYVVNDFTHSYVESPLGAVTTINMNNKPSVDLNGLTKDSDSLIIRSLMNIYNSMFNR